MKTQLCVCTSGKYFHQCCEPFLTGVEYAKTPQQLMRSRYSAFALGGFGAYLLRTWLPDVSQGLDDVELSNQTLNWVGLEIHRKSQHGDVGTVEFKAYFLDQNTERQVHHEVSVFHRVGGRWLYANGDVLTSLD